MAQRRMTPLEMEKWLLSQGSIPVTEEMKKEPWYAEASKLPPCMAPEIKRRRNLGKETEKS
jgi:hypothetical protein